MENFNQYDNETAEIFKEECSAIINDFKTILNNSENFTNDEYITKLMRDAHSIKGSAGIMGMDFVQKLAHHVEDLLGDIKNSVDNNQRIDLVAQIKILILQIEENINNSQSQYQEEQKLSIDELFLEISKNITILKSKPEVVEKLIELISYINSYELNNEVKNILSSCLAILSKVKKSGRVDSSLVTVLSGAFKILNKIVIENNSKYYDELFLLKQRLSVAEQMADFSVPREESVNVSSEPVVKQKIEINNVFGNFAHSSIKTLRIDSSKLDKLFNDVCEIGKISVSIQGRVEKLKNIADQFSEHIFEFEKILSDLTNYVESKDSLIESQILSDEIKKMQSNLINSQNLMLQYENLNSSDDCSDKDFRERIFEIYSIIENVRKLPIGVILHMYPRMVRDIAEKENKEVEMDIIGGENLVDKQILDELKMPILHLLRNAVDHGIELPEEREKQGKSRIGKISVSVTTYSDKIKISVKDDGCGINFPKIKAKVLQEKKLGIKDIKSLNKHDFIKMLFNPGFSTEDKVTEISGRGIGLDIVYTKIAELNGQIQIQTDKKEGTEIIMEIPLNNLPFSSISNSNKEQNSNANTKIILIDDSQTTKMYMKKILLDEGYSVTAFSSAKDALKELKLNHYDLLISDVEMPGMDGAELTLKVRGNKKLKDIPILIVSMLPEHKVNHLFKNLDVNAFINKSEFNKNVFLNTVRYLLED